MDQLRWFELVLQSQQQAAAHLAEAARQSEQAVKSARRMWTGLRIACLGVGLLAVSLAATAVSAR